MTPGAALREIDEGLQSHFAAQDCDRMQDVAESGTLSLCLIVIELLSCTEWNDVRAEKLLPPQNLFCDIDHFCCFGGNLNHDTAAAPPSEMNDAAIIASRLAVQIRGLDSSR